MKKFYLIGLSLFLNLIVFSVFGQQQKEKDIIRCNTTVQFHEERIKNEPIYRKHILEHQLFLRSHSKSRNPGCADGPIIIPVAIHFDDGVVPVDQEACAITLVQDQIDSLNFEINGNDAQNDAYGPLQSCFPDNPAIGDACIEFCIATYFHPSGYGLTEGDPAVTFGQIDFTQTTGSNSSVPYEPDWAGYLNIYVNNLSGGLLGQAAGIPGLFNGDGVVIDACTFGTGNVDCPGMNSSASCGGIYNEGNTLTHEVGHYLGLFHIWGDNSICTGDQDMIDDTPDMSTNYSGLTDCADTDCADLPETCSSKDMYMNYMSYAGDACMYMFTSDQADVMNATAISAGFSDELPFQCVAPVAPIASFTYLPDPAEICEDLAYIDFYDASTGPPSSWNWTFSGIGVNPQSSTLKNPTVTVTSSGDLIVSLISTNISGTSPVFIDTVPVIVHTEDEVFCDTCFHTLNFYDSYGDGWNGAELEVHIDNVLDTTFTMDNGSFVSHDFEVAEDQLLELVFVEGSWDSEITFELRDAYNYLLYEQLTEPSAGTLFTDTITCNMPTCDDGILNGAETSIDCGGPECDTCPTCGLDFYDSGGPNAKYSNNENLNWTFCPDTLNEAVTINITYMQIQSSTDCNKDKLAIYNGRNTDRLIGEFCGSTLPTDLYSTSSDGCLYAVFTSNGSVRKNGWEANISCDSLCTYVHSTDDSGYGSLRDAIDCAREGDTIRFSQFLFGDTINLSTSTLILDKDLFLLNDGDLINIHTSQSMTMLAVNAGVNVKIEGLRFIGESGSQIPLIKNSGELSLTNTEVKDMNTQNNGQSILNESVLTIENNVHIKKE